MAATTLPADCMKPIVAYMHQYHRATPLHVELEAKDGVLVTSSSRAIALMQELAVYTKHLRKEEK